MKIFNTKVQGFEESLRAMRNPMNSWHLSDSCWHLGTPYVAMRWPIKTDAPEEIGPNDLKLFRGLNIAGPEHRKAIRMIEVWGTFVGPRYWWVEADTYKVATTKVSCSTMHKLGTRDLDLTDFAYGEVLPQTLETLNDLGRLYRQTKDYDFVKAMKRILPEGFMLRADLHFSYETAKNMFQQRRDHRLEEWRYTGGKGDSVCDWISRLPYMGELVQL
jgi:hypothetical protein